MELYHCHPAQRNTIWVMCYEIEAENQSWSFKTAFEMLPSTQKACVAGLPIATSLLIIVSQMVEAHDANV